MWGHRISWQTKKQSCCFDPEPQNVPRAIVEVARQAAGHIPSQKVVERQMHKLRSQQGHGLQGVEGLRVRQLVEGRFGREATVQRRAR